MSRKPKLPDPEDDGHVIAPMNVEGMPWYKPERPEDTLNVPGSSQSELTSSERRLVVWGAIRTGLLIFAVFAVIFLLFLLFSDYIWFGNPFS